MPWWIILPLAFLLHFVLDTLPHFGEPNDLRAALGRLKWFLPIDAAMGATVLLAIFIVQSEFWPLAIAGGVLCASPDLWSVTRFIRFLKRGDTSLNKDWFAQFHSRIQHEYLWGAWIELAWTLTFGFILASRLW
jgi:hypothetical protein